MTIPRYAPSVLSLGSIATLLLVAATSCSGKVVDGQSPDAVIDVPSPDTGAGDVWTDIVDSDAADWSDEGTPDSATIDAVDGAITSCDPHDGDECNLVTQNCPGTDSCTYSPAEQFNICSGRPLGPGAAGESCDPKKLCKRGLFCFMDHCAPACCPGDDAHCAPGLCNGVMKNTTTAAVVYHLCTY